MSAAVSPLRAAWREFRENRIAMVALGVVLLALIYSGMPLGAVN